jgi:hypothetical protein
MKGDGRGRPSLDQLFIFARGFHFLSLNLLDFNLLDQSVDFFWRELACVFRHAAFAVVDDVAQVVGGGGGDFFGDERWSGEVATLGGFPVTLGAVLLEHGVRGQGRASIRRLGLGGDGGECERAC